MEVDLLIVGAGPVGCTVAERAASLHGWRSLIIDQRSHIAGNCYDERHNNGVLIHRYGPHYFRTNSGALLTYLSRYTRWIPGNYIVKCSLGGNLFPFPINLLTLEKFFGRTFNTEQAEAFLETIREKIEAPSNSEEYVLSRVGRRLYEAFYLGYTTKQWGRHPRDLAASVCGRIPVYLNQEERYCAAKYQVMPEEGFTRLFERMISSPLISTHLRTGYREIRGSVVPRVATVYCGPIDEYFDYRFGKLEWRSLAFEFREHSKSFVQPCVQVNYPGEHDYTRTVEFKHVTGQTHPHTVVSYEYPRAEGEPYYPIPATANEAKMAKYRCLAEEESRNNRVFFAGRLAEYKYINMDEAVETGLRLSERLFRLFAESSFGDIHENERHYRCSTATSREL